MLERTLVRAHKLGRELYQENRDHNLYVNFVRALAYICYNNNEERDAFVAGYLGERRCDHEGEQSFSHWGIFAL